MKKEEFKNKTAWDKVLLARSTNRPTSLEYINNIFDDFIELHGDRCFGDDASIVAGIGMLNKIPITIIAQQRKKYQRKYIKKLWNA